MGRDARRTFLVLCPEVDLFAALRPILDSEMLQVTWGHSADQAKALADIAPWPWAVAGSGAEAPTEALSLLAGRPALWFWLGGVPDGLPAHTRVHSSWRTLARDTQECLEHRVGGMHLAPNRGLIGPGAGLILCAELEGLVGGAPVPMRLRPGAVSAAERVLKRLRLPASIERRDGAVRLVDL